MKKIKNIYLHRLAESSQMNWLLSNFTACKYNANYLLAETYLSGHQVTLDGYVQNEKIMVVGIVDSVMYPETISFSRFEYPSRLPESVQHRMQKITQKVIKSSGLNHTMFNIEFMYNSESDEVHIIEINTRLSSQFSELYEKVDGFNSYEILIDLALGKEPDFKYKNGAYKCAASFFMRTFSNQVAIRVPSAFELDWIKKNYPDSYIDILIKPGKRLDSIFQDYASYRYCIINIGAENHVELMNKYESIKAKLYFEFEEVRV